MQLAVSDQLKYTNDEQCHLSLLTFLFSLLTIHLSPAVPLAFSRQQSAKVN